MTALHDPFVNATPSMREEAKARIKRLTRIASNAKADTPIVLRKPFLKPKEPELIELAVFSMEKWVERQKKIPLPWFSVEEEIEPKERRRPLVSEIIAAVALYFGVSRDDIISPRRTVAIVRPRQIVYYLSREMTLCSLPEIGRRIGGRDHTSTLSGLRKIERLRQTNQELDADLHNIAASLGGSIE